jgi:plasmid maintenance system antidote protein VapI
MLPTPTAADIRAELARRRVKLYRVAVLVGLHPARLSVLVNEHAPMSAGLAERLMRAIEEEGSRLMNEARLPERHPGSVQEVE